MSDQTYTDKENAKSRLYSALYDYFEAATKDDLTDSEQAGEIMDIFADLDKEFEIIVNND